MELTVETDSGKKQNFGAITAKDFLQTILGTSDNIVALLDAEKRPVLFGKGATPNQTSLVNTEMIPVHDQSGNLEGYILRKKERRGDDSDYLTGIVSRSRLESEFAHRNNSRSAGSEFVLLFIDLNHFKPVNEIYGHLVGDQVLLQFAALLKNAFRSTDCVARYGGDEFVVLCDCPLSVVEKRVSEFQNRLAGQYIEVSYPDSETEKERITLGFSFGMTLVATDDSFTAALNRADKKLLLMKKGNA